jgi:hypothetical protein
MARLRNPAKLRNEKEPSGCQDCDRIGELVDEAIHKDNLAKASSAHFIVFLYGR